MHAATFLSMLVLLLSILVLLYDSYLLLLLACQCAYEIICPYLDS